MRPRPSLLLFQKLHGQSAPQIGYVEIVLLIVLCYVLGYVAMLFPFSSIIFNRVHPTLHNSLSPNNACTFQLSR